MSAASQNFSKWQRENPNRIVMVVVALLVVGLSIWTGTKARRATQELDVKRVAWEQTSSQLANVQQQFRAPTATESAALIAESSSMGALGVQSGDKLTLVESVGRLAEACGLTGVRVTATLPADSSWVAPRDIGGETVKRADFDLSVEVSGGFAGVIQFVNSLSPSVTLARLGAARRAGATTYQLVLSVYELNGNAPR